MVKTILVTGKLFLFNVPLNDQAALGTHPYVSVRIFCEAADGAVVERVGPFVPYNACLGIQYSIAAVLPGNPYVALPVFFEVPVKVKQLVGAGVAVMFFQPGECAVVYQQSLSPGAYVNIFSRPFQDAGGFVIRCAGIAEAGGMEFLFFFIKGLIWLFIFFGGAKLISELFE